MHALGFHLHPGDLKFGASPQQWRRATDSTLNTITQPREHVNAEHCMNALACQIWITVCMTRHFINRTLIRIHTQKLHQLLQALCYGRLHACCVSAMFGQFDIVRRQRRRSYECVDKSKQTHTNDG